MGFGAHCPQQAMICPDRRPIHPSVRPAIARMMFHSSAADLRQVPRYHVDERAKLNLSGKHVLFVCTLNSARQRERISAEK